MKVRQLVLAAVIFACAVGMLQAQDGELHGSVDFTYQTSHIWRGFDIFPDDHSAIQPALNLDLYGTGFGLNVVGHRRTSSGAEEYERWDYNLYYANMLWPDEPFAAQYALGYVYYNYPEFGCEDIDLQEINAAVAFPKLLGIDGLVPSYVVAKLWPSSSGSMLAAIGDSTCGRASGWAHILMLDYAWRVSCPLTEEDRVINLHSEVVYNDGVHPGCATDVDSDWSNAVFGVSTDFAVAENMTLTPGVFYQSSWEDTVNTQDELWATLKLAYSFKGM